VVAAISSNLWVVLAGFMGAILPVALRGDLAPHRALVYIGCSSVIAWFVAPAIYSHFWPTALVEVQAGISFTTGVIGLKVAEIVLRLLDRRGDALADQVVDRIAGRQGKE